MLKLVLGLLFVVVLVECGSCPHSINKRQAPRPGPRPEDVRPPPPDGGKGDRRPRPTLKPTNPPPISPNQCNPNSKFSTFDGSCNNLANPKLGMTGTSYKRYLRAEYADGIRSARTKSVVAGQDLPNPRLVSRSLMTDNTAFENDYSDLLVYFGQFLSHDLTEIGDTQINGEFVHCPCGSTDPNCLSYPVPLLDNKLTQSCLEFTRSGASASTFPGGESHEQINHLTSYIDGTQVYGSSKELSDALRTFSKGQLKTSNGLDKNSYLPLDEDDFTCSTNFDLQCFIAGETRASENLALTGVHTTFMREHNRIANRLAAINPLWSDETLYQETRRINIAIIQNIVYSEFLPLLVGTGYNLSPLKVGYYAGYDQRVNPSLSNEFAVAAFRFGHSLIRNSLDRFNYAYTNVGSVVNLSQIVFDSTEAYNNAFGLGGLEAIFMGLLSQPTSKFDANVVDHLQNHLFEFTDGSDVIALDLPATNINRGRDHGIPAYYKYRELCGSPVTSWESLVNVMSAENIKKLQTIYSSFRDVDLFVGGLHETPQKGALVGPTFACIIDKQFRDLKNGDRFYFENGQSTATRFSSVQLDEIRKVKFSTLICENFNVVSVQPNAFKMAYSSLANARTSCNNLAKMDLSKWKQ